MLKFPVDGGIVTIRSSNRRDVIRERTDGTMLTPEEKLRYICMAAVRHDMSIAINSRTSTQYPGRIFTRSTEKRGQPPRRAKAIQAENAGATYQRLVDKAFDSQVGRNMEVYVDDLVIKSHTEEEMIRDINETFRTLRRINMKLNPKKCTFGAREGMFLGYMISPEGIKPCPDKTEVVLQLPSPRTIKEVQSLNGKLASLNRFLSKSAEKSLPLFKTLKKCIKKSDFHWTPEAEQAFKQLKQHLSELPLLVAPKPKEELIVYLAASHGAISAVLMTERDMVQMPVYFENIISHTAAKDVCERTDPSGFPHGSSCVDGFGVGLILTSPEGTEFTYALRFQFTASNNEAEYEALIAGLRIRSANGSAQCAFPRSKNKKADALSKIESTSFAHLSKQVLVEILKEKSIQEEEVATVVEEEGPTWMTPVMEYLKNGALLGDRKEASKLRIKARQYELLDGVLYRRSFLNPWLRCVGPLQADYVTREIHEGSCSMHAGPRSVVSKAMQLGYYWPTMHRDARDMIRACNDCQIHRPVPRNPQQPLTPITAPWPFYKWGIDIAGPFPEGPGKVKKFVWDNIVCRFGLPGKIVSDNGKQFNDNPFKDWCTKLNITQRFASVKHPQSNGLVERANRSLGEGIKSRLGEGNKNWI
ncbi:reverse transcriptase domain-containing protein [Tanacetum coccineum]|uniref:Reverse transcriptase domain-containing protein n=1 Tax=Tanacetum coccineum TaxID=301880 RepID=A0ABQ5IIX8_9ASTR